MPQSSLLAWLNNKSAPAKDSQGREVPSEQQAESALPTPSLPFHGDIQGVPERSHTSTSLDAEISNSHPALPPTVSFRACTKEDIPQFKRLNSLLLPIPYPESFYRETYEDRVTNNITLLAFWQDSATKKEASSGRLIGAIRCRILDTPPVEKTGSRSEGPMLYLSTLVLLSPYRNHGIATHMLRLMTQRAINDYGVVDVGAHVWEANSEGLEWYRKRGFIEMGRVAGYYRRLNPQGAVILRRAVSVMDLIGD